MCVGLVEHCFSGNKTLLKHCKREIQLYVKLGTLLEQDQQPRQRYFSKHEIGEKKKVSVAVMTGARG